MLSSSLPKHIAIIMDGNGRWAQSRALSRSQGHQAGIENAHQVIQSCHALGLQYLTLFAFSSENWKRPQKEIHAIFELISTGLYSKNIDWIMTRGIRIHILGSLESLSAHHRQQLLRIQETTRHFERMHLNIAISYGGRWDLVQAMNRIISEHEPTEPITEHTLSGYLSTANCPDPELLIRTGGESRISNFLLWQLAYTELYFTEVMWPDFDTRCLQHALQWYDKRQRRFGSVHRDRAPEPQAVAAPIAHSDRYEP